MADRNPVILYSVPPPSAASNPYTTMLAEGVSASAPVRFFSWRAALTGGHDVLHVHWPETMVRHTNPVKALLRGLAGHAYLTLARRRGIAIVRTVHNRSPHEDGGLLERAFLSRLDKMTTAHIFLSDSGAPRDAIVIPHGHYRDWEPYRVGRVRKRPQLLMFGALRRYKGVESAIAAFRQVPASIGLELRIAGQPSSQQYLAEIADLAKGDARIRIDPRRVPDRELAALVAASAAVVLPYKNFYNSGAALLALSLGSHIIVPASESALRLADEFGPDWVTTYEGPLSSEVMIRGASEGANGDGRLPDMAARDWATGAAAHVELYRSVVAKKTSH